VLADGRLGFLGQQQAAQPAGRVGQGGGDGVVTIQPDGAFRRLRLARARMLARLELTAAAVVAVRLEAPAGRAPAGSAVTRACAMLAAAAMGGAVGPTVGAWLLMAMLPEAAGTIAAGTAAVTRSAGWT
jgi:hypothetical protein